MSKILVLPDMQVHEGVPLDHLDWVGKYIIDKRPDIIVQIGDFADMPSLSSYDYGKKSFEGRRYTKDIKIVREAMARMLSPLNTLQNKQRAFRKAVYKPRLVLTLGNHEHRIDRAVELDPKLEGLLNVKDLGYEEFGWEVHPFLDVVSIEGVCFSHYFTSGVMGRPVSSPNVLLNKKHVSCVQGHLQHDGIASQYTGENKRITGIFAGACYLHNEEYLGPQGNIHWRGVWMLNDVNNGEFEPLQVSLKYLERKYGQQG